MFPKSTQATLKSERFEPVIELLSAGSRNYQACHTVIDFHRVMTSRRACAQGSLYVGFVNCCAGRILNCERGTKLEDSLVETLEDIILSETVDRFLSVFIKCTVPKWKRRRRYLCTCIPVEHLRTSGESHGMW